MKFRLLVGCFLGLLSLSSSANSQPREIRGLARVVDGDTISIARQRIRIAAIDACERDQLGTRNGKSWQCGQVARSAMMRLANGQFIRCRIVDIDRYRRPVGQCFDDADQDIGLTMLKNGMAETMFQYLPRTHSIALGEYSRAEKRAQSKQLGIWSAKIMKPADFRRQNSSN